MNALRYSIILIKDVVSGMYHCAARLKFAGENSKKHPPMKYPPETKNCERVIFRKCSRIYKASVGASPIKRHSCPQPAKKDITNIKGNVAK